MALGSILSSKSQSDNVSMESNYFFTNSEETSATIEQQSSKFAGVVGWMAFSLLCIWVTLATIYIILHDDLLAGALQERLRMQAAYEEKIAAMQSELDLASNKLVLNEHEYDKKIAELHARQAELESQQNTISSLMDLVDTPSIKASGVNIKSISSQHSAIEDDEIITGSVVKSNTISLAFSPKANLQTQSIMPTSSLGDIDLSGQLVNSMDKSLAGIVEEQQDQELHLHKQLNKIELAAEKATKVLSGAIRKLGFSPRSKQQQIADIEEGLDGVLPAAVGGPFIDADQQKKNLFKQQILRTQAKFDHVSSLYRELKRFPILKPLRTNAQVTSRFGNRLDPFLRRRAFHAGIDYRAPTGTKIYATAPGIVVKAHRHSGYGRLVEIRHDNGIFTRYAHMSRISVKNGQRVAAGDLVGRVGSSGRSTGPHLHYETRIGKDAVNPQHFLTIGRKYLR